MPPALPSTCRQFNKAAAKKPSPRALCPPLGDLSTTSHPSGRVCSLPRLPYWPSVPGALTQASSRGAETKHLLSQLLPQLNTAAQIRTKRSATTPSHSLNKPGNRSHTAFPGGPGSTASPSLCSCQDRWLEVVPRSAPSSPFLPKRTSPSFLQDSFRYVKEYFRYSFSPFSSPLQ